MNLPELELKHLGINDRFMPFDGATMDVLERDKEAVDIMSRLFELFYKMKYEFSSPGNSLRRRVCGEMYQQFIIPIEHPEEYFPLFYFCKADAVLMKEYTDCISALTQKAIAIKYRIMNAPKLELLSSPEFANGVILKSKALNQKGKRIVIDSYLNIPEEILGRLHF